jgi:hypothetical protein
VSAFDPLQTSASAKSARPASCLIQAKADVSRKGSSAEVLESLREFQVRCPRCGMRCTHCCFPLLLRSAAQILHVAFHLLSPDTLPRRAPRESRHRQLDNTEQRVNEIV